MPSSASCGSVTSTLSMFSLSCASVVAPIRLLVTKGCWLMKASARSVGDRPSRRASHVLGGGGLSLRIAVAREALVARQARALWPGAVQVLATEHAHGQRRIGQQAHVFVAREFRQAALEHAVEQAVGILDGHDARQPLVLGVRGTAPRPRAFRWTRPHGAPCPRARSPAARTAFPRWPRSARPRSRDRPACRRSPWSGRASAADTGPGSPSAGASGWHPARR